MPRTYVNNASNQSLGRVGMPVGSMVVSRSSGASSSSGGVYGGSPSSSASSSKVYVDNAQNRSLGRVGMEHGTMVASRNSSTGGNHSASTGPKSATPKVYVDNAQNRNLGRVGMEHGMMVVSKGSSNSSPRQSSPPAASATPKVYVDSPSNRRLGRVGVPHGDAVNSKNGKSVSSPKGNAKGVYKDTPLNRQLGRVNKPLGTCKQKTYVDNQLNRHLGRVGKEIGRAIVTTHDPIMERVQRLLDDKENTLPDLQQLALDDMASDEQRMVNDFVTMEIRRQKTVKVAIENDDVRLFTDLSLFQGVTPLINYSELAIGGMLGAGATAKVLMANLRGTVVAVKEMNRTVDDAMFKKEAKLLGSMNHINIVKLLAAVLTPRCLVMEYVHDNLFKALFIERKGFSDDQKDDIVIGMSQGLHYLHQKGIAHCDIKSLNILLQYSELGEENESFQNVKVTAKLADFGLSRIGTDPYKLDAGGIFGTIAYMPPEVMLGNPLTLPQRCMADIYSLALVMLEVLLEERNFKATRANKIKQLVCKETYTHPIHREIMEPHMANLIEMCLDRDPTGRPKADEVVYHAQYGRENSSVLPI